MAGPEGQNHIRQTEDVVIEFPEDVLDQSGALLEALGDNPTAERVATVLGVPGTGVTGITATIPAPGETGTDITALGGTQDGIPPVDDE